MNRTLIVFLSMLLTGLGSEISAQEFTIRTGVVSKYLGKPGILFYDGPENITILTGAYGDFYAYVATFTGLNRKASLGDNSDEIDGGIGLAHTFDWVKVSGELSYYMLNKLNRADDDRWIVDLRADLVKFPIVQPYLAVRYFGSFTARIPEGGWFCFAGVQRVQPLPFLPHFTDKPNAIVAEVQVAYSDGALHREPGWVYSRFGVSMKVPLAKGVTFSPSILWQVPTDTDRRLHYTTGKTETVIGGMFEWKY